MTSQKDIALQKLPPQNIEAEQMVLGAILIDNAALDIIVDALAPDDFYRSAHQRIYKTMLSLHERREAVDLITLTEEIKKFGGLEEVGGASYPAMLVSLVPTAASIKHHAAIVREKSVFRRAIAAAHDILEKGYDESQKMTAGEFLDHAEQSIFDIARLKSASAPVPMQTSVGESFKLLEYRYEHKGELTGIPTGFTGLDEQLAGLQNSDLIIVAGRPSMGKTAFALNISAHAALAHKKSVAIFSLEMSREQLTLRLMGSEARVDAHKIRTGNIGERDWAPLSSAAGVLAESRIFIDDAPAITALELRARARRIKAEHGLDLVVVDYLQLMRGAGHEGNREQEISGISRALKALAKDLGIPVVALSQLNRALESRSGKDRKPVLSDLRESGAIEQDADVILFIYREEVYNQCNCPGECLCGRRGAAECIIGKQRNGDIGKVDLQFLRRYTRFENRR